MKILWITNIPSPYRVDFFNKLGESCELTVLFERENATNRDDSWKQYNATNFRGITLNGISITNETSLCFNVVNYLKRNYYDQIVVSNPLSPTGMLSIEILRMRKIPYVIEGDGGFAKGGKGIKEMLKSHIIPGASLYFSTSRAHDDYYLNYGAKKSQIRRYPFTSVKQSEVIPAPVTDEEKTLLRNRLGINENKMILSVGQFINRKGIDVLLKSLNGLSNDVGIYIIGGSPTKEYIEIVKQLNLTNVHFLEFQKKEDLKLYYQAADLFVLPTRHDVWGLVINEAMANGLPVITTDKCIGGLELITNGKQGYIISVDDIETLRAKIRILLKDAKLLKSMSFNCIEKISEYTIERMADRHLNIFKNNVTLL